jgi:hypothetical protein
MKHGHIWFYSLWMSAWLTLPVFASTERAPNSGKSGNAPQSFILKVQEWQKERGGSGIFSYGSEMFRESRNKSSEGESRDRSSETGMRSYSDFLGPSFDMPDSVHGHSDRPDPWWGRRGEPEPMLKDVNRDPMKSL